MKINTLLSPLNADELYFTNKLSVVIDVLRATTTIVNALMNGAKEIIPVSSIEFAMKVSGGAFGGHTLLGGERNTVKIEGFNLGNSPLEYSKESVDGKSIVLFTTNGSKAVVKAKYSKQLLIASLLNAKSIAKHIAKSEEDVEILCSGNNGMFSFEDSICAGMLISELKELIPQIDLNDSSKMCLLLFEKNKKKIGKALLKTEHGKLLVEKGFEEDIIYSAQENIVDIVPYYEKGVIKSL